MRNKNLFFFIHLLLILFTISGSCVIDGQNPEESKPPEPPAQEFSFVEVPDPLSGTNPVHKLVSKTEPPVGLPFKDQHFNTQLVRVTERGKIRHEYSRFDPFNKDQTMIILHHTDSGDFIVYRTQIMPYEQDSNKVRNINNLEEIRWDPVDANLVWGQRDFSLIRMNVKSGEETVIKDFTKDTKIQHIIKTQADLYRITMKNEGESSADKRFWCFMLQGSQEEYRGRYLISWDRKLDKILGLYKIPKKESEIDWVGMSYLGSFVLIGGDSYNGGNLKGLTMANRKLTRFHRLAHGISHSDVGLDTEGKEVIVMQNDRTDYIDLIPIDWNTKPILESGGSYEGTNIIKLVRLFYADDSPQGMSAGIHLCCNHAGYCVVSTFLENQKPDKNWLDRCNILIRLDWEKPRAFYLSKVYNTSGAYWEETQATISNDGSKVMWTSNWSKELGKENSFLLQLNMPENWQNLLKNKSKK